MFRASGAHHQEYLKTGTAVIILMQAAGFSLHKDTTPPQPNHTVTPTHIEPEQYNP
jgi:hypothetical protein